MKSAKGYKYHCAKAEGDGALCGNRLAASFKLAGEPGGIICSGHTFDYMEDAWRCQWCARIRQAQKRQEVNAKRTFVAKQTKEAASTARMTVRGCGSIPVWAAYRCLYCGEYFNQATAEEHFGKRRNCCASA